ncbi:hypothetical protein D8674_010395 [Pyrus ussuriensis x Pyrus communis]|uniref:Uncharacterized protein n=1 Tax=Pyrus ussuriensis x Pyrus communis TaxID=2448454 RepID=A0A5N5FPD2_9ROSA|nr:hypothetical protein D8674_010395 [Pyrus ussuriensis x Pyrus communis]
MAPTSAFLSSLSNSSLLLHDSMLKCLSLRNFLSNPTNTTLLSSITTTPISRHSLSSLILRRPISRLQAPRHGRAHFEQPSPYLLHHAHNPVSLNFRTGFSVLCCLDCFAS